MEKKKVTLFVVSNQTGKTRKIVLSAAWLKAISFISAIVIVIFAAGMVDYFGLLLQAMENKRLKVENAQLIKQFQIVESKVSALENSLERVKTFTTKLKLITNVDSDDRITKLTMGPKPAAGQQIEEYEPMEQRPDGEALAQQDQVFANKKPLNDQMGELANETTDKDYASLVVRIEKAVKETQLKEQSVIDLWEGLSERQSLLSATPNIKPAKGWLTSRFGYRSSPFSGKSVLHAGLDIAAAPGSPVYAPADGVVTFASYDEGYGKLVSVDHGYGVSTRFGHMSQIYVQVGQRVNKWDVLGAVGNTGRSTGPHLHYEVRINGTPVDPINYILDE
ncbi:M23 family metallopeptidase [Bdellovibrio svalbardensis]|uniref:M23 family metallopeptidase n=1 Tax=Bdellovibrio svalbardensis TaxID=2972972 RepID=A0ABT6DJS3_9BACT|nr:M23 family metallopeptidase [Bdellovibrio svalbardensis]MDG0817118.1 M23 family metallopeptidase [Bdellovibrio svalbardensis]